jgi:transglutaminase-like putative cysteine protease
MQFAVRHITTYRYSAPVHLGPHILRLTPRSDGKQRLLEHACQVSPQPALRSSALDAEGNVVTRLWFTGVTGELRIESDIRIETLQENPYDFIVDTPSASLPMPYNRYESSLLAACRYPGEVAPEVVSLAAGMAREAQQSTLGFLEILNSFLHDEIEREIRVQGAAQKPELTLARRMGACRDLAVLFIAICRTQGIAARFVSGYQARAEHPARRRYLHAWPEVYIPGGGWRGYDPSHGLAVAEAHVSVAASYRVASASPIEGAYYSDDARSLMEVELTIDTET